ARHRELAAAAEAEAGHRRHERRPERADRVPALEAALAEEPDRRGARQLGDVGSRGEGPFRAAEDDAADAVVPVQLLERRHELLHQLVGERVQLLRPVEEDDRDRAVAPDDHLRFRNAFTASCAGISSHRKTISRARRSPTMIGSHCVAPPAGTEPCSRPTWRMNASSTMTARSHAIWSSFPPPTAIPFTRATVGLPISRRRSCMSLKAPNHFQYSVGLPR